jgi:hypothetical protein
MSNHSQQTAQQSLGEQEVCDIILETSKQGIQELSEEDLAEVAGGLGFSSALRGYNMADAYGGGTSAKWKSAAYGLLNNDEATWRYAMGQAATRPR